MSQYLHLLIALVGCGCVLFMIYHLLKAIVKKEIFFVFPAATAGSILIMESVKFKENKLSFFIACGFYLFFSPLLAFIVWGFFKAL